MLPQVSLGREGLPTRHAKVKIPSMLCGMRLQFARSEETFLTDFTPEKRFVFDVRSFVLCK